MARQADDPVEPQTLREFKREFPAVWEAYEKLTTLGSFAVAHRCLAAQG